MSLYYDKFNLEQKYLELTNNNKKFEEEYKLNMDFNRLGIGGVTKERSEEVYGKQLQNKIKENDEELKRTGEVLVDWTKKCNEIGTEIANLQDTLDKTLFHIEENCKIIYVELLVKQ